MAHGLRHHPRRSTRRRVPLPGATTVISAATSSFATASDTASDTPPTDRTGTTPEPGAATRMPRGPVGLLSRRERAASFPPYAATPSARQLDDLYGPPCSPRAKPGKSAIQWQERAQDGTVVIHPRRSVFAWGVPSDDDLLKMQQVRASVQGGRPHKWMIDTQGALVLGPTKVTGEEWPPARSGLRRANSLGHVTLVGGTAAPPGRIGGVCYHKRPEGSQGDDGPLVIDNDSGRYSEFPHLEPRHLENVAHRFEQLGCAVVPEWIDMQARQRSRAVPPKGDAANAPPDGVGAGLQVEAGRKIAVGAARIRPALLHCAVGGAGEGPPAIESAAPPLEVCTHASAPNIRLHADPEAAEPGRRSPR